jgi:multicomponent Na+:H+ antiporter subunit D
MLAYSSVGQVGYIALGVGLASPLGLVGALLHALNHACMKACLFCVQGNLRLRLGHAAIPHLDDGTARAMPWTMAAFTLGALSMIGLPPTAGFFSKWYLAVGTVEAGQWPLLAALLVSTLLNAVYFFRIFEQIYLKPAPAGESGREARGEVPASMLVPTVLFALLLLLLGLGNAVLVTKFLEPVWAGVR